MGFKGGKWDQRGVNGIQGGKMGSKGGMGFKGGNGIQGGKVGYEGGIIPSPPNETLLALR